MEQLCLECGKRIACKTLGVYTSCGTKMCTLKQLLTLGFGCGATKSVRLSLCSECATKKSILAELYRIRAKYVRNNSTTQKPGALWHPSGKAPLYDPKKLVTLSEVHEMSTPLRNALLQAGAQWAYYDVDTGMFVAQSTQHSGGTVEYGIMPDLSTWKVLLLG